MGSSRKRQRASQQVVVSGKKSSRQETMSPETKRKIRTSYKSATVGGGCKLDFEDAFANKDAEWKATQRARAAQPRGPNKRAKVLLNMMNDTESQVFVDAVGLGNPKEIKALRLLANNIKEMVEEHNVKGMYRQNKVRHFRKVVAMLVGSETTKSSRLIQETARLTGLDHRMLLAGIVFRNRLLAGDKNALFAMERYASPGNKLSTEIILQIIDYYENKSATDPGAKQVSRQVINSRNQKVKDTHAKHYYPTTGTEFFRDFITKYPALRGIVRQRAFDSHRPWYFRRWFRSDRRTCACIHHIGPKLTVESFARMRQKNIDHIRCLNAERAKTQLELIAGPQAPNYSLNSMAESICCPKAMIDFAEAIKAGKVNSVRVSLIGADRG
jgi:hypothetical protein